MEAIIALVPPVLASIAGIFPILLESLPESLNTKSKPLAIILLIAGIWVIHILTLSFGYSYTLFSPTVTVITLIVGISVLAILLEMSLRQVMVAKYWVSILYITSIIFLVAGFSNHLLMQNNTVVRFSTGNDCTTIKELQWRNTKDIPVGMHHVNSIFGIGAVWPKERYEDIKDFVIYCQSSEEPIIVPKGEGAYQPWGAGESFKFRR